MELVQSMFDGVSWALYLNPSTLSGSIDIIVVRHPDGSLHSTPFHVRFGKLQLLYSAEKTVDITVNNETVPFKMKLGAAGEAYFLHEKKDSIMTDSPAPQKINNESESEKIDIEGEHPPSEVELFLQEHPEAVAVSQAEDTKEASQISSNSDNQRWNWTWGWGSLPRIESDENKKDEEILMPVTVMDESKGSKTGVSSLFGLFKRKKPQYLESSGNKFPTDDFITIGEGDDCDSEGLFEMDDNDEDEDVDSLMFHDAESDDESNIKKIEEDEDTEKYQDDSSTEGYHTLYSPGSPIISRTASPLSVSEGIDIQIEKSERKKEYQQLAQSLPNGKSVQMKSNSNSSNSTDLLWSIEKSSLLTKAKIEISLCGQQIFDIDSLTTEKANEIFENNLVTHEKLCEDPSILSKTQELYIRINSKILPWKVAFPSIMSSLLFNKPLDPKTLDTLQKEELSRQDNRKAWMSWLYPSRWRKSSPPSPDLEPAFTKSEENTPSIPRSKDIRNATSRDSPLRSSARSFSTPSISPISSEEEKQPKPSPLTATKKESLKEPETKYRRSLRPTMEQIKQMKLNPGANSITFSVNTELRGTQTLVATVYLWEHDSKLIVSDIDGTITRSDVFGHVLPMVGKDWSHFGVAKLFSSIRENGYHIVYLTSRAIGQAQTTRNFINNLKQDGDTFLPKGPVFMSPDRLFWAFNREIIRRKPEEFKIACLQDIARLFPKNPFYAGFGNRPTDMVAYEAAGVPPGRVFIINPSGKITTTNKTYSKTYHNMAQLVNEMYPPTREYEKGVSEDYNDWNYWKIPVPDLDELKI